MITKTGNRAIDTALDHIATHYADADQVAITHLAELAHYSRFHFTRLFTRLVGHTPSHHIAMVRFEQAKILLTTTDMRIVDVATQVGRRSPGTFTGAFHTAVGCSPKEFRKQHRKTTAGVSS